MLDAFDGSGALIPVTVDSLTGLRIERHIDDFGVLSLKSFDGAVLVGTELISLPELLEEGANALQGLYGTMLIDPISGTYEYDLDSSAARHALNNSQQAFLQKPLKSSILQILWSAQVLVGQIFNQRQFHLPMEQYTIYGLTSFQYKM